MAHDLKMKPDREWTEQEREALGHAMDQGGAFIEQIGRFDVREWSPDEFQLFVNTIALAFTDRLRELNTSDDVPF